MSKPVYDYRKGGLRFRLYPDGNITVSSKDLPERSLYQLGCDDFDITHKAFNSLCRDGIREGDVDGMLAEQARISRERGMKRNAGVELYAALEDCITALEPYDDIKPRDWKTDRENLRRVYQSARAALAKARGEK